MIKLIASDLDGTLLNKDSKISEYTKENLKKYIENGVNFAFCTGRAYVEMDEIVKSAPFIKYSITANGSCIVDTQTNEKIYESLMSKKDIQTIYNAIKGNDFIFEIYMDDVIYCDKKQSHEYKEYIPLHFVHLIEQTRNLVDNMEEFINNLDENSGAIKLHTFFSTVNQRDEVFKAIKNMPYDIISQSFNEIEFNKKNVNKGTGIQKLAEKLGIKKEEIIAFGDNFNDISMRDTSGTLVAVENAVKPLKEIADYITKTNQEDGVIHALKKYIG